MIYFLSDAHLGSKAIPNPELHQQKLVDWLRHAEKDAEEIYLLGDIFDFWYEYFWERRQWKTKDGRLCLPKGKEQFRPVLEQMKRMTGKGIRIHYFIGNHDIWTFGALADEIGLVVHREPAEFTLQGKRCLLAHGDGLVPEGYIQRLPLPIQKKIKRFILLRAFFHHPVPQCLFRLLPPAWGDRLGYDWARHSREKELRNPCGYKGEDQEELVLWAKEHSGDGKQQTFGCGCHYYIFGHRHIELDLQTAQGTRIVILGDHFKQWTYAQMQDGDLMLLNSEDPADTADWTVR